MGFIDLIEYFSLPVNENVWFMMIVSWCIVLLGLLVGKRGVGNRFFPVMIFWLLSVSYYGLWTIIERIADPLAIERSWRMLFSAIDVYFVLIAIFSLLFPLSVIIALDWIGTPKWIENRFWLRMAYFYVPVLNLWKPYVLLKGILERRGNWRWAWLLASWWFFIRIVASLAALVLLSLAQIQIESWAMKMRSWYSNRTIFSLIETAALESIKFDIKPAELLKKYPPLSKYSEEFEQFVDDMHNERKRNPKYAVYAYPEFFPYSENFKLAKDYLAIMILIEWLVAASWILVISLISNDLGVRDLIIHAKAALSSCRKSFRKRFYIWVDRYYEMALMEFESGHIDKSIWATALVNSDGDANKSKALYVKYRAHDMFVKNDKG